MYQPGKNNKKQLRKTIEVINIQKEKLNQQLDDISKLMHDLNQAESI